MPPGDPALSVQLRVAGRRCVVVGAGAVAARRVATLLDAHAAVTVVAPGATPGLVELAGEGRIELVSREFRDGDLDGAVLVVAATGVPEVDGRVGAVALAAGVPVNRADAAADGDVAFPAVLRRGPVVVAISTGGRAPAVTRWLADLLDERLDDLIGLDPDGYELLVDVVEEVRAELRETAEARKGVTPGPPDWRSALDGTILELIEQGRRAEAKERLLACLSSS